MKKTRFASRGTTENRIAYRRNRMNSFKLVPCHKTVLLPVLVRSPKLFAAADGLHHCTLAQLRKAGSGTRLINSLLTQVPIHHVRPIMNFFTLVIEFF